MSEDWTQHLTDKSSKGTTSLKYELDMIQIVEF